MVDTNKLRGVIAERRKTVRGVASEIGISSRAMYNKMRTGSFDNREMSRLVDVLGIENPVPIFFAELVAQDATDKEAI